MTEGKDLLAVLWSGADVLRGKMDANEYKTYLLGLVFYKYLSDSYLAKVYDLLNDAKPDSLDEAQAVYEEAMKSEDASDLLEEIKDSMHYTLDPDMTYISMLNAVKNNAFNREKLQELSIESKSLMNFLMDCLRMWICTQTGLGRAIKSRVRQLRRLLKSWMVLI